MSVTDQQRGWWRVVVSDMRDDLSADDVRDAMREVLAALDAAEQERDAFAATVDALNRDWQRAEAALERVEALAADLDAYPNNTWVPLTVRQALNAALAGPSPTDEGGES